MVRELKFEDQKATYLLLNIMAHDVIHDYGPGSSDVRWENNLEQVKRLINSNYTFGGDPIAILQHGKPIATKRLRDRSLINFNKNKNKKIKIEIEPPNDYINSIHELKEDITTSILFSIFDKLKYIPITTKENLSQKFSVYDLDFLLGSKSNKDKYNEIIKSIIEKIEGVFVLEKQTEAEYTIKGWLIKIIEILSNYSIVETAIVENPLTLYEKVVGSLKRKVFGGADTRLNHEECQELIDDMNTLLEHTSFTQLQRIYDKKYSSELNDSENTIYINERKKILDEFKKIFIEYGQQKKAGSIYGIVNILPPVKIRTSSRNAITDLKENFKEKINTMLAEYYTTINQYNADQKKIMEKKEKEQIKLKIEEEIKNKKRKQDEIAANAGDLTSDDKEVRQQFVEFIAKSGLFVTGVCDKDGNIEEDFNEITEESLITQINILLSQANWINTDDTQPTKKRKKELIKWRTKTSLDLDGVLIAHFKKNYRQINERYVCSTIFEKYVVNNAAPIDNALTDKRFCPYTSILDGMSQCSYKSSMGNREYGNMDFKIMSNKPENPRHYHGKLDIGGISNGWDNEVITINLSINPGREISINSNINTKLNGDDLKAHYVLKNTLISIIDYISILNENEQNQILSGNIFENLFSRMSTGNNRDFNRVYSHILIKGTGDLFQEINCVCKHGGYSSTPTTDRDSGILEYPPSGDQLRLFVAKDRPSGTRFIYMLINGNPHEINTKAVGGYYSTNYTLLVKHHDNTKVCEKVVSGGRKRTLKHNKNIPRRTRKRNHHIK